MQHDRDAEAAQAIAGEDILTRREALKKVSKLVYTAPVLTVIPLSSNAQNGGPPSPPGGGQQLPEELRR